MSFSLEDSIYILTPLSTEKGQSLTANLKGSVIFLSVNLKRSSCVHITANIKGLSQVHTTINLK